VMYSYRSGCSLGATDKKLLWWVAMLPFFYNFLTAPGVGLRWLLPDSVVATPLVAGTLVVAAINLHHFIVDGYIWRLKKGDSNYRVVESGVPA